MVSNQYFASVMVVLLINQAVADPLVTGLVQVATKEVVRNWVQSRVRRSLADELAASLKTLGNDVATQTQSVLLAMAVSPFLLPLWLPLLLLGSAFFVTTLAPTVIPNFVRSLSPMLDHLTLVLRSFGFDEMARSLDPQTLERTLQPGELIERGLDVLDVKENVCRRKMFCEVGSFTLDKQPAMARFVDLFSETVSRTFPVYSESLIRGIRGSDCSKLFEKCDVSPLGKVLNYYFI